MQRSTDGTTFAAVATVTSATFAGAGLKAGTTYYYRVVAVNAVGRSPVSGVASAVTTATK